MRLFVRLAGMVSAVLLFGSLAVSRPPDSGYHLLKTYKFAAAPSSTSEYFDYITVDSAARRVYLSRGTAVEVMNADSGAEIGYISGFKRQHGVALAPEFGRGFISDGTAAQVTIFDMKTLKTLGQAKADPDTDCIVYDPASKRVFTMNGDSHSSTVIDAKTGMVVKTIDLIGSPEFAVADGKGMIYANLANKDEVAAIDARTMEVKSRWPTATFLEVSTALAMDREHRRLFSAGRKPQVLAIMDADSGKVLQSFPITAGTDAVADHPRLSWSLFPRRKAKFTFFTRIRPTNTAWPTPLILNSGPRRWDSTPKRTGNLFVDTSDFGKPAAATADRPNPRPAAVLGTFRVLVYGRPGNANKIRKFPGTRQPPKVSCRVRSLCCASSAARVCARRFHPAAQHACVRGGLHQFGFRGGLFRDRTHRIDKQIAFFFRLGLRGFNHHCARNNQRKRRGVRVESVIDQPLGNVHGVHAVPLLARVAENHLMQRWRIVG